MSRGLRFKTEHEFNLWCLERNIKMPEPKKIPPPIDVEQAKKQAKLRYEAAHQETPPRKPWWRF